MFVNSITNQYTNYTNRVLFNFYLIVILINKRPHFYSWVYFTILRGHVISEKDVKILNSTKVKNGMVWSTCVH